ICRNRTLEGTGRRKARTDRARTDSGDTTKTNRSAGRHSRRGVVLLRKRVEAHNRRDTHSRWRAKRSLSSERYGEDTVGEKHKTFCRNCSGFCGLVVETEGGQIT